MTHPPVDRSGDEVQVLEDSVIDLQIALDDDAAEQERVSRRRFRHMVQWDAARERLDAALGERRDG